MKNDLKLGREDRRKTAKKRKRSIVCFMTPKQNCNGPSLLENILKVLVVDSSAY